MSYYDGLSGCSIRPESIHSCSPPSQLFVKFNLRQSNVSSNSHQPKSASSSCLHVSSLFLVKLIFPLFLSRWMMNLIHNAFETFISPSSSEMHAELWDVAAYFPFTPQNQIDLETIRPLCLLIFNKHSNNTAFITQLSGVIWFTPGGWNAAQVVIRYLRIVDDGNPITISPLVPISFD